MTSVSGGHIILTSVTEEYIDHNYYLSEFDGYWICAEGSWEHSGVGGTDA